MNNADQPIHPCIMQQVGDHDFRLRKESDPKDWQRPMAGLTKREYFASLAMQGIIEMALDVNANYMSEVLGGPTDGANFNDMFPKYVAYLSVQQADALIDALNKQP